jgi:hypothetical protein
MLKKLLYVAALSLTAGSALLVTGCASNASSDRPYGLTGTTEKATQNDPRYLDSKGHYRPDWVNDATR